jgi:hypothetical protein
VLDTRPTRSIEEIETHLADIDSYMSVCKEGSPAHTEIAARRAVVAAELAATQAFADKGVTGYSVQMLWVFDRQHGSLYDRGRADSYYDRSPVPHYGGVGGGSGDTTPVTDPIMVAEYMAGYDDNEAHGDKKDWGFDY